MTEVYRRKPAPPDWPKPYDITEREIDPHTGLLWTPACGDTATTEYYIPGTEPVNECSPYSVPPGTPVGVQPSVPPPRDTTRRP